jgi:endo-1,4-beta-xylanase
MEPELTRRSLLRYCAALCAGAMGLQSARAVKDQVLGAPSLKAAAQRGGRFVGMFSGQHELMTDPVAARTIATEFDMLAIGNDLKMNRIHPAPDKYDFTYGDWDLNWSQRNGLLFRGHTLVWHNALPAWFSSYVTKANAEHVMNDHITTVMKHYAGRIYSWDVVNEPIHNDGRPDGLRVKPWLDLVGPDYIEIAFRAAAAADPKAKLVVNECYVEQDLPQHAQRREALLQLATRLKRNNVPITGIGVQGHIVAAAPLATSGLKAWLTALQDLGLEITISELDVDDTGIPAPSIDDVVARKYAEFLDLVGPFARVVTLEQLADNSNLPKRSDGLVHRPNIYDTSGQKKPAYNAVAKSLGNMQRYRKVFSQELSPRA